MSLTPESINSPNDQSAKPLLGSGAAVVRSSTPLLWLTVLSLDAPAVAVLWQLLFARSFQARLDASVTILLALVVWLIYVADRGLDVLKAGTEGAEASRHIFYRRHWWAFLPPFCAVLLLAAWMSLTRLDARTFRDGIVVLLAVGVYFLVVHFFSPRREWLPKEMMVGVLFALGTCFPVWEHMTQGLGLLLASYLLYTALCWMNCAAIEFEEWNRLRHRRSGSPHPWTIWMGHHFTLLSLLAAAVALCLIASGFGHRGWHLLAAELLSALLFAWIHRKGESLSMDHFRVLVDVALFTPLFFLPF